MLVGSTKGILCLNLTLAISLLALLGWILFGSSGDSHTNTKIARCLGTAVGGFLANLPIGALMGAVAPSLRKLRWLARGYWAFGSGGGDPDGAPLR